MGRCGVGVGRRERCVVWTEEKDTDVCRSIEAGVVGERPCCPGTIDTSPKEQGMERGRGRRGCAVVRLIIIILSIV